jgi:prepilin-type N-terminal cleavage/methylation domain-containing protein
VNKASQAGFSLVEVLVGLVIFGVLTALGLNMFRGFGARGAVKKESEALVDALWDLRSKASTGMANPCLDFTENTGFRAYSDAQDPPNGFGDGDRVLETHLFSSGIRILSIQGGSGPSHTLCFESQGILGSANAPLLVVLGRDSKLTLKVSLLPATGMARVQ